MTPLSPSRARAFILANTAISTPPHVPEIRLRLADEAHDLWHRTEEELEAIGLPPPFWAFAWAGGQVLARYVLDHPGAVRSRRVVDFAAGSGLVAIAAARSGAGSVEGWDIDPFAANATALNAELNGVAVATTIEDRIGSPVEADVLLAGDVFFDREMAAAIIPWFDALSKDGVSILVGDPGRAYLPRERLEALATYEVPVTRALEDAEVKRSTVWRWKPL
ncbi:MULTISPECIES: class I SAM-dependent methyltransferase [unclassified Aureimonas]|uniref:class I SAM-dependent methyltransferase n=1 Tax=unclassified Aureimonas TaxID=2615206 RepID=UPI0006F40B79|nr:MULTISPECIES: methyltransferase [unclassified Aureimonas]KQT61844.1 nicotinamide N-methyase [Aureimonas sp. Leaf427]KQT74876.1 nicotinamide N-methyase [Aureimonas sp. Leaf460]